MTAPKISVLTPMYNTNPNDLRAMIESILGQTYGDFEFLLLNDSPDNTELEQIVRSYNDVRIKYIANEQNMGITKSRNKLIDLARGEYLAVADHDDISTPNRFELEVACLDANPHIGAVGGNVIEIRDGVEYKTATRPIHDHDIKLSLINDTYVCNPVHSGCMIRKSVLEKSGVRYNENWSPCEDRMLFVDLIPHTCFHNLKQVVLKYVWTGDNTTLRMWQKMYDLPPMIVANARAKYPIYYDEWRWEHRHDHTRQTRRIKLFGFIPLIKIRFIHQQKKIYLFDWIQLARIKYE
ncbi:MAG: glycosyltransferase family 2 protein [Alphaproteobacteria bacterium]|nr:glycosyltransferase family 2 protein [Alphaproteobacteria bacterium]